MNANEREFMQGLPAAAGVLKWTLLIAFVPLLCVGIATIAVMIFYVLAVGQPWFNTYAWPLNSVTGWGVLIGLPLALLVDGWLWRRMTTNVDGDCSIR